MSVSFSEPSHVALYCDRGESGEPLNDSSYEPEPKIEIDAEFTNPVVVSIVTVLPEPNVSPLPNVPLMSNTVIWSADALDGAIKLHRHTRAAPINHFDSELPLVLSITPPGTDSCTYISPRC